MTATQRKIILASPPSDHPRAAPYGNPIAHMAYRIGANGRLFRTDMPSSLTGGIMVLDAEGFHGSGDPSLLCRDIIRECTNRKFDGILCDFTGEPTSFLTQLISQLSFHSAQRNWTIYLPEKFASLCENSIVLVSSEISSGSLESILRNIIETYGNNRIALVIQRISKEFRLPAGGDSGKFLTRKELGDLVRRYSPSVFFDDKLCTHYFTYMDRSSAYFILFDDSGSLLRKLTLARNLGISRFIFTFPDVEDILPRLLSE